MDVMQNFESCPFGYKDWKQDIMPSFSLLGHPGSLPNALPYPSALSVLIARHGQAGSDSCTEGQALQHPIHLRSLALTVLHNLQYQHDWTGLRLHYFQPPEPGLDPVSPKQQVSTGIGSQKRLLARPLVSGVPPERLYLHPEDQMALITADKAMHQRNQANAHAPLDVAAAGADKPSSFDGSVSSSTCRGLSEPHWIAQLRTPRREWVLPTHLREKWSLHKFAEVFDGINIVPEEDGLDEQAEPGAARGPLLSEETGQGTSASVGKPSSCYEGAADELKRVLLATVGDDSTIVYYIVHDGIVKPRQN